MFKQQSCFCNISSHLLREMVERAPEKFYSCIFGFSMAINIYFNQGRRSGYESGGGDGIHVNPERSFGGTNGEPPSEASQLRKGGPGAPRKISKTYMANGAIYVIPELYL